MLAGFVMEIPTRKTGLEIFLHQVAMPQKMLQKTLTHVMPLISFYTPWKRQKTYGFMMISGGVERDQGHEVNCGFLRLW